MTNQGNLVPPSSLEAEKSTIGSLLVDKDSIVKIADFLKPEDFYHDAHRMVYQAICDLYDKRSPIDLVTLTNILEDRDQLKLIGGASYLALLANEVPTATHIFQYATIVKSKSILRRLILAGDAIKGLGYRENDDVEVLLDQAEKTLFNVSQTFLADRFVHIKDILNKTYEKISDLHDPETKEKYRGIPTGFKSLDNILSGLQPSDLVVIAARPSMGKTALALNIAQNIAKRGKAVGLISLEMSKEQLVERMFCSLLSVDSWKMRTGRLTDEDFSKIGSIMDELNSMKIFIDDSMGNSISELKAKARRLKMESGLDVLVIDYLQLMSSGSVSNYQVNRVQEISEISRSLKSLARDLSIPIVALSQLSRAVELRPSKIPQLSDLRECVTGDTRVLLSDGSLVEVKDLEGQSPEVWAVDKNGKIVKSLAEKVWKVGKKPVYTVKLASGRSIRATDNHRLLANFDWCEIGKLQIGDRVALIHKIPEPETPVTWPDLKVALLGQLIGDGSYLKNQPMRYTTASEENSEIVKEACEVEFGCEVKRYKGRRSWHQLLISGNGNRWKPAGVNKWLRDLGIFDQRSHQKRLPQAVFSFNNEQVALLLRHLWATDGTIYTRKNGTKGSHRIHYSTNSQTLAADISTLLLRFGIVTRIETVRKQNYRPVHMITVSGSTDMRKFLKYVGFFGPKRQQAEKLAKALENVVPNTNVDSLPKQIFEKVKNLMKLQGISQRQMATLRGTSYGGTAHFNFAPSRAQVLDYAEILKDESLKGYCNDDLFWDKVVNIFYDGIEEVFDLSVPGPTCWIAENVVSHNSGAIEQDADVVLMLYREDYYEEDTDKKGVTDVFIRKHRNGPTGHIELSFKKEQMKFVDIEKTRKFEEYAVNE